MCKVKLDFQNEGSVVKIIYNLRLSKIKLAPKHFTYYDILRAGSWYGLSTDTLG